MIKKRWKKMMEWWYTNLHIYQAPRQTISGHWHLNLNSVTISQIIVCGLLLSNSVLRNTGDVSFFMLNCQLYGKYMYCFQNISNSSNINFISGIKTQSCHELILKSLFLIFPGYFLFDNIAIQLITFKTNRFMYLNKCMRRKRVNF